ncbi:transcriptional regulator [Companilactobacillus paralimentarius DSM 13238 = JCM 10415]|mgnify:CR=1 FL=1|jgi:Transcriptional regulator|uniref:Transcriptional regulator n=2 Tax=Companilactobacillus paralimentarius TaxID=83526 RepID=A0A0R1PG24_9LACO|nr:TetR/AcrR family transcriptional regulator [Companilactobacillus paralimentarius]KAE9564557.1 transcriptional regulator [Companilactobacillus paralimentarius]KRL31055.1 transcriptional regulator [Companilactobacillus paralimentarius DSM 13238 = JCM 10415]MDR4932800.1 TetR/AcrR family transcriptional regulator [Companilactobacillus paralimentarius]QFR69353.1 TetR family transcriptional regulator [Companilactobacillus paralimentarius]
MNVRDQQAENTKNAILQVAAKMFLSQGYQATSTRKIAQELNITQPNMYHYYKNKKVLYIKAIEYSVNNFSKNLLEEYSQQKDLPFEDLLLHMSKYMIENFRVNYFIMRNDIENFFTVEERTSINNNWDGGYYKVLFNIFQSHKSELRSDLAIPVQVGTFLTMLLPYIEYNDAKRKRNIANLNTVINIFINGVKKE